MEVSLALPEYPIQFPDKMEIELDISFIYQQYNRLNIKGAMEEQGFNGFEQSEYANGLYRDAKANAQRKQRLQRRLHNLENKQQNLKHQMKQRIFKAGIEYYEARAKVLLLSGRERNYQRVQDMDRFSAG